MQFSLVLHVRPPLHVLYLDGKECFGPHLYMLPCGQRWIECHNRGKWKKCRLGLSAHRRHVEESVSWFEGRIAPKWIDGGFAPG